MHTFYTFSIKSVFCSVATQPSINTLVRGAVRSCSRWLHSKAASPPTNTPSPTKCVRQNMDAVPASTAAVNTHRPLQVAFATTSSTIKDRRRWGLPPGRSETADAMGSPPDD